MRHLGDYLDEAVASRKTGKYTYLEVIDKANETTSFDQFISILEHVADYYGVIDISRGYTGDIGKKLLDKTGKTGIVYAVCKQTYLKNIYVCNKYGRMVKLNFSGEGLLLDIDDLVYDGRALKYGMEMFKKRVLGR